MDNKAAVRQMIEHIDFALSYCREIGFDEFTANRMVNDATLFNICQVGELVVKIDEDFQQQHPEIPWRLMKNLRNVLIHNYTGINFELVWQTLQTDLPDLKEALQKILE